ncbi:MAG: hypothetical protein JNL63_10280 [Bacteroidia bacterium]|nr:hypothetical protein [Bacteroidia bacterium]
MKSKKFKMTTNQFFILAIITIVMGTVLAAYLAGQNKCVKFPTPVGHIEINCNKIA